MKFRNDFDTPVPNCPVCGRLYSPRHCPWCGWEMESGYVLGPLTPEERGIYQQRLEEAQRRWGTKKMETMMINPRYESDLNALNGIWDLTKVISSETVFIVTGCHFFRFIWRAQPYHENRD